MSVNQAWQGRRFKTQLYKEYIQNVLALLPETVSVPEGPLFIHIMWGHSNAGTFDWDNGVKPFQDILQKKYNFNDNLIGTAFIQKVKVKKGEDYIKFLIMKEKEYQTYMENSIFINEVTKEIP